MKLFISLLCLFFSASLMAQSESSELDANFSGRLGGVSGTKEGVHVGVGVDVSSGDFYKISGSLGRQSHDYLTVGHVDALLKKNFKLGKSDTFFVLGYSPISLQSSSISHRTEALLTPKVGLQGSKTLVLYSFSPLASVTNRSSEANYRVMMHGMEFEQEIGDIFKVLSTAKLANKSSVKYFNLNNQVEFKLNPAIKLYGFYDLESMKEINDSERSIKLSTAGVGIKLAIGSRTSRE